MNTTMKQRAELRKAAAARHADLTVVIGSIIIAILYAGMIYLGFV